MVLFHFKSFRSRMMTIIMGTVLVSQTLTFLLFNYIATNNANFLIRQNLNTTSVYFKNITAHKFKSLQDSASLLVGDFAFKNALATKEESTVHSALVNHQNRIQADIMMAFSPAGKLITYSMNTAMGDTEHKKLNTDIEGSFQNIIQKLRTTNSKSLSAIIYLDKKAYQITLVPIYAPQLLAYTVIGHALNNEIAQEVASINNTNISFLLGPNTPNISDALKNSEIVGSTVTDFGEEELKHLSIAGTADEQVLIKRKDNTIVTQVTELPQTNESLRFFAVIQIPYEDILENYTLYRPYVSFLTLFLLVIAIPAAILMALRTTSPIEVLAKASEKIEKGNYNCRVHIEQEDEIGLLGSRFNNMAEGLAEREKMEFLAFHDSLTKLPNRRLFFKKLQESIESNKNAALIMIDLDGFKAINDDYGHDAGDETLKHVASLLNDFKKHDDDIIARLGGDEFAILLNNLKDKEVISKQAKNIIEQIEHPIPFSNETLHVSASLGICLSNPNFTIKDWMKCADNACYDAKNAGKRTFKFSKH